MASLRLRFWLRAMDAIDAVGRVTDRALHRLYLYAVGKASGGMRVTLASPPVPAAGQAGPPAVWAPASPPAPPQAWPSQGWPHDQRR